MPVGASGSSGHAATLGLIAGQGELPHVVSTEARKKGYTVIGISLKPPADESLKDFVDDFFHVRIGQLGKLISLLKKKSVSDIVLAGKVPKNLLYKNKRCLIPDGRALRLLFSLKDRSDDTIMTAIVNELEEEGFRIHDTTSFTEDLLCPERVLTRKKPSRTEWRDIEFGWKIKDMAVMAVEAIEGTDEAIVRGGHLAKSGAVVLKVSKPQQDMRFDVPVVGRGTLRTMKKAKAGVLAIEASKTIILDLNRFIEAADEAGIVVAGVRNA
jgi:DUF1009 family protein